MKLLLLARLAKAILCRTMYLDPPIEHNGYTLKLGTMSICLRPSVYGYFRDYEAFYHRKAPPDAKTIKWKTYDTGKRDER